MKREYAITSVGFVEALGPPVPVPPTGDGWRLGGASVARGIAYFFWEREAVVLPAPCENPICTSIAFKNGHCVGCGRPQPVRH